MKKGILLGLTLQLGVLVQGYGQQVNALEIHNGNNLSVHALDNIDSIGHKADSLLVYEGGNTRVYAQQDIDSAKYVVADNETLPCGFGNYTGQYDYIVDSRDGNEYKTIQIGNQRWMAENLRYDVPNIYTNAVSLVDTFPTSLPCRDYGRLYDWNTLMDGSGTSSAIPSGVQGICPSGWHVPSDGEWKTLEKALGLTQAGVDSLGWRGANEGRSIKSAAGWANNGNGSNSNGFNAFPAGIFTSGNLGSLGEYTQFWSTHQGTPSKAWYRSLYSLNQTIFRNFSTGYKSRGFSCRCVED